MHGWTLWFEDIFIDYTHVESVVLPTPTAPTVSTCPYFEPVESAIYKNGVTFRGNDAGWYQWQLNKRGYGLAVDKIAGTKTWKAINDMQAKTGVGVGNAGPRTRNVIRN